MYFRNKNTHRPPTEPFFAQQNKRKASFDKIRIHLKQQRGVETLYHSFKVSIKIIVTRKIIILMQNVAVSGGRDFFPLNYLLFYKLFFSL